jgi:hypothetical protein
VSVTSLPFGTAIAVQNDKLVKHFTPHTDFDESFFQAHDDDDALNLGILNRANGEGPHLCSANDTNLQQEPTITLREILRRASPASG